MTIVQFWSTFRTLSTDVLVLAAAVSLLTALCKKTVMKSCPKKVFVVLPFVFGIVLYAVYRALVTMSAAPFTSEICSTLEKGFSCGLAATLYYVVYEQFFRAGKITVTVQDRLLPFLDGVVAEKNKRAAADEIARVSKDASKEELPFLVRETLRSYADPELTEAETEIVVQLIVKALTAFCG